MITGVRCITHQYQHVFITLAAAARRSYDAHHHEPQQFFTDLQDIDSSRLVKCSSWLELPGQAARCENRWWKAPSCRHKGNSSCIPCLTAIVGEAAYRTTEVMQKAAAHQMPIALGVTPSIKDLHDLVAMHDTLFVFWEPDITFLLMHPRRISFPKHNPAHWASGDYTTASEAQDARNPRGTGRLPCFLSWANNTYGTYTSSS